MSEQKEINTRQKAAYAERENRIKTAQRIINGIFAGYCPCGYCGTISSLGHCFKCGTEWGISPKPNYQLPIKDGLDE